jgi:hypothetical protein
MVAGGTMTILNPMMPYAVAKGYMQSAFLIMTNGLRLQTPDDTSFFLAFHMLCGFALELYLKAYLAHKGYSEEQLKRYGHDLARLHDRCKAEGMSDTNADTLVGLLAEKHLNFEFRYMKPASEYRAMDLQVVFLAFSSVDQTVDSAIGASATKGKGARR